MHSVLKLAIICGYMVKVLPLSPAVISVDVCTPVTLCLTKLFFLQVKVKFGANCSSAFLLSSSPEVDHSPKVVVCLSNGEVHLLSVRKCLEAQMKGKGKQRLKRYVHSLV